ncbi:MAG: DUF2236 domain-containing protein, partial [Solirubrobacterales bacterium]|nr:DUF2236 domain-containing protein [Solirubrobacterales bacterium]
HRQVGGVTNDAQVHVLGCLIYEPFRVAEHFGQPNWFCPAAKDAWFSFWQGVARGMRLRRVPPTDLQFTGWMDEYEAREFKLSHAATESTEALIRGWATRFPAPLKSIARAVFIDALADHVRQILGYHQPSPALTTQVRRAVDLYAKANRRRPLPLNRTLVSSFSRVGPNPDYETLVTNPRPARADSHLVKPEVACEQGPLSELLDAVLASGQFRVPRSGPGRRHTLLSRRRRTRGSGSSTA